MSSQRVIIDIRPGGLATVTLNRPEVHNAFDDQLITELTEAFRRLDSADDARVVLLAAHGKSFSAGGDLNWMRSMAGYTRQENVEDALRLAQLMQTLDALSKPTIARVQGSAFGGGVGLIACCDIAIASENSQFSFSEVKLGLIPAAISPYVVAAIGARQARRYFVTGERFSAAEAQRIGLLHEVKPEKQLDNAVEAIVAELQKGGPQAQREGKRLVKTVAGRAPDGAVIRETAELLAAIRASREAREGIGAFLEKRAPSWITSKPSK